MNRIISAINLFLALFMIAMVIVYASIVIPITLACGVGFILVLWLYSNLVDGVFILSRKIKSWRASRS